MNHTFAGLVLLTGGAWLTAYARRRRQTAVTAEPRQKLAATFQVTHPQLSETLANAGWEWVT